MRLRPRRLPNLERCKPLRSWTLRKPALLAAVRRSRAGTTVENPRLRGLGWCNSLALIGILHCWQSVGPGLLDCMPDPARKTNVRRDHLNDSDPDGTPAAPSKSRRKRESTALQNIGKALVQLPTDQVQKLDLPEPVLLAVLEAQRIKSHSALRRQMQYIGKLMRDVDAEPIVEQLAAIHGKSETAKARFHGLERWRERLLADDQALTELLAHHPEADGQQLHQLIRNARRESAAGKPPRSSRALFRMLTELQGLDQE